MAGTASQAVKKIRSWHGYSEADGRADRYIVKPWGRWTGNTKATAKKNPWCQITVSECLHSVSVSTSKSAGCTQAMKWYKARKRWKANGATPKAQKRSRPHGTLHFREHQNGLHDSGRRKQVQ